MEFRGIGLYRPLPRVDIGLSDAAWTECRMTSRGLRRDQRCNGAATSSLSPVYSRRRSLQPKAVGPCDEKRVQRLKDNDVQRANWDAYPKISHNPTRGQQPNADHGAALRKSRNQTRQVPNKPRQLRRTTPWTTLGPVAQNTGLYIPLSAREAMSERSSLSTNGLPIRVVRFCTMAVQPGTARAE